MSDCDNSVTMMNNRGKGERNVGNKKLVVYYTVFSIVWFLFVNVLEGASTNRVQSMLLFSRITVLIYIIISGGILYYLLTRQKQLEGIHKEEQRVSALIHSMVDFVTIKDENGRWIEANDFGVHLFQLENVDYRGMTDAELGAHNPFFKDIFSYCEISDEKTWLARKNMRCEEIIPQPNGETKILDVIKVPLFHSNGARKALIVIGRDITEQKMADKKLAQSEQRYKSLFKYNPDVVYMIDLHGVITDLSPHFEVVTGYKTEEFIGKSILRIIDEEYRNQAIEIFKHVLKNEEGTTNHEVQLLHKDGSKRIVSCTTVPMIVENQMVGVIGYGQNVTEWKRTEEQLRKAEMLSTLGELAAGVAHEIRNPLTALRGFVQLLHRKDTTDPHYYEIMLNELDRINNIVSELLVLAKPQKITFEKEDIRSIVKDVMSLLETQANFHGVEMTKEEEEHLPLIDCEGNQLKQLFINLIKNSFEANASHVKVEINRKDDTHIVVTVRDNGSGISKERLKHLGEPFFSYKEKGTGLGLTVSYRIIEFHKGSIVFDSKLGEGTTATVTLPISNETRSRKNMIPTASSKG